MRLYLFLRRFLIIPLPPGIRKNLKLAYPEPGRCFVDELNICWFILLEHE